MGLLETFDHNLGTSLYQFSNPEMLDDIWHILVVILGDRKASGNYWVETRNPAKHPIICQTVSPKRKASEPKQMSG